MPHMLDGSGRWTYFIGEPTYKEDVSSELSIKSKYGVTQEYKKIIAKHNASNPFEDPEFPRTDPETIGKIAFDTAQGKQFPDWDGTFQWRRAKDLLASVPDPKLRAYKPCFTTLGGPNGNEPEYSKFDILQGMMGDCWFISGLAEVTSNRKLITDVIPADNLHNNDSGAYHFIMVHDGVWVDVVVDDWCPCAEFAGPGKGYYMLGVNPVLIHELESYKIWPIMIEKAYAKLNGSYHMIEYNAPHNALEDLTGGLGYTFGFTPERMQKPDFAANLWNDLKRDQESGNSVMVFGTDARFGDAGYLGIHQLHAYTMTGIAVLEEAGNVKLIRMRNPWGRGEWTGDWSDNSPKWNSISAAQKEKLGFFGAREDGEFWIDFDNVLLCFAQVDVCLGIQLNQSKLGQPGKELVPDTHHRSWSIAKGEAGGAANPAKNPQFLAPVGNPAADWDYDLMIALQQKTTLADMKKLSYGFSVYWVEDPTMRRWKMEDGWHFGPDFFAAPENKLVRTAGSAFGYDQVKTFTFGRDVTDRFKVKAGTYLVVPTTAEPNVEADFVLRVWRDEIKDLEPVTQIKTAGTDLNADGTWTMTSTDEKLNPDGSITTSSSVQKL